MDIETLWRIVDEGSTPVIAVIAFILWKLERSVATFMVEIRTEKDNRDAKLNSMHADIGAMIRKLAGMTGDINK